MTTAMRFDGAVAIVTGAGRGIGREHALALAARGGVVVVNDPGGAIDGSGPGAPVAQTVAEEIRRLGGLAVADSNAVGTREAADAIIADTIARFGRLDILINNAGIVQAEWDASLAVNLSAAFWMCSAAWPHLAATGRGRILNTTSAAGLFGMRNPGEPDLHFYAYGAAKAGICGLTRGLALEGAEHGIKVNAIAPVAHSRMSAAHPDPRVGQWLARSFAPDAIATVALMLVHEQCSISGHILSTGGGRLADVFVGETRGITTQEPQPEIFLARIDEVLVRADFITPQDTVEESAFYHAQLREARTSVDAS